MIQLMVLVELERAACPLSRDILFVATADEETDGQWGAQSINHHYA